MVQLLIPLFLLANLAVGFASPFIRATDEKVVRDVECIQGQIAPLQATLDQFSSSSTAEDAQSVHDLILAVSAAVETAAFDAAEVSEFTPTTSALVVDKLVDLEPAMFAWMFRLMCIKPYLDALGYSHHLETVLVKIRVDISLFVAGVQVRLPSYLQDRWAVTAAPIERMLSQVTTDFSREPGP